MNTSVVGKRKRVLEEKKVCVDIQQMDIIELKQEEKRLQSKLKDKKKQLDEAIARKEENEKKKGITQAGNEDGKVAVLATKWIQVCQDVLETLQSKASTDSTIGQMITQLGIDPKLLNYNEETDGFNL